MMLDATAGNRMMWPNKNPPNTVFIDIETGLGRPPTLFASSEFCPFRDMLFSCIIFDPPWGINMPPWWNQPSSKYNDKYYGTFKSKRELFSYIHKSQKEFQRLTSRVCLKWGERNIKLWNMLPFFTRDGWKEIYRRETGGIESKTKNYWVTLIRSSLGKVNKDD